MPKKAQKFKVAVLCGGPSLERGISLNSARSILDHLSSDTVGVIPFYLNTKKQAFKVNPAQLYSNTPSDFDFKLKQTSRPLSKADFVRALKKVDLVFPAMHGPFGEDGTIQRILEKENIPFIGADSATCAVAFDKHRANNHIRENGFFALPSALLKIYHTDHAQIINDFFKKNKLTRAIVKPASGGSSIGVFSVTTPQEALEKAKFIFSRRMDTRIVLEPFATGREFTAIILQNRFNQPVCVLPTEIETDYRENQIFNFRRKYLPTRQVTWHCPPRFSNEVIEKIQIQAEQLFSLFGFKDFARFDGWILPSGDIWFADFNPISGMEQNSFLFQQASRIGLSHADVLHHIVKNACRRFNLTPPAKQSPSITKKKTVNIIFGGSTSERQVSIMSGTNAWLKLRKSKKYAPQPYFLDLDNKTVFHIPYAIALSHTAEEMSQNCARAQENQARLDQLTQKVRLRLAEPETSFSEHFFVPKKISLDEFVKNSPFVLIGLHGGLGEDGRLQKELTKANVKFSGSNEKTSQICIDKHKTKTLIDVLKPEGINSINELPIKITKALDAEKSFQQARSELGSKTLLVKPRFDGCSSGVARIASGKDFRKYVQALLGNKTQIKAGSLKNQDNDIELPIEPIKEVLLQEYCATDKLKVVGDQIKHTPKTGWLEITVGLIEQAGLLKTFDPSIAIAEGEVLSVEEKFQGGTGVNLTPPPGNIIAPHVIEAIKRQVTTLAQKLNLSGYARIDAFVQCKTGQLKIIEVNTLPALTPSTVLFHQALNEQPPIYPTALIEKIIKAAQY